MIITRTPFRITLGGGGTDLPEFYMKHGGFWINAAIDKYVYVCVNARFEKQLRIVYSKVEAPKSPQDIEHPIIRELIKEHHIWQNLEFVTYADLPAGSGLGSSGAFTVGSILALKSMQNELVSQENLAEFAYMIEHDVLGRPVGKQDQYSAAFGGMRVYVADEAGKVKSVSVYNPEIERKLMLIYTGETRESAPILEQVKVSEERLKKVQSLGRESLNAINDGDWIRLGELMDEHWSTKQGMADGMSSKGINWLYKRLKDAGAVGGKIVGAGGGGFLLMVVPDADVRNHIIKEVLDYRMFTPFKIVHHGAEVIHSG